MPDRVVRGISLNAFVTVLANALLLIVTHPAAIRTNHELVAMIQHKPATTEHRLYSYFLVSLLYLSNAVLDLFKQFLVFPAQVEVVR